MSEDPYARAAADAIERTGLLLDLQSEIIALRKAGDWRGLEMILEEFEEAAREHFSPEVANRIIVRVLCRPLSGDPAHT